MVSIFLCSSAKKQGYFLKMSDFFISKTLQCTNSTIKRFWSLRLTKNRICICLWSLFVSATIVSEAFTSYGPMFEYAHIPVVLIVDGTCYNISPLCFTHFIWTAAKTPHYFKSSDMLDLKEIQLMSSEPLADPPSVSFNLLSAHS